MENKKIISALFLTITILLVINAEPIRTENKKTEVYLVEVEGEINKLKADIISRSLNQAMKNNYEAIIILMDTPGGSGQAMMDIIKEIESTQIPVITYVHPAGAKAASAGTYISMASDIIAMSPSTSIGACEPILGYDSTGNIIKAPEKIKNFYTSYMKSLAESNGRNVTIAEKFVTENLSLTQEEALQLGIIDLKASSVESLLGKLDGFQIKGEGSQPLNFENAETERYEKSITDQVLNVISEPTVNYILLIVGIFGLAFGFLSPGWHVPEVIGSISLLLAIIGSSYLSFQIIGYILILASIAFFVIELETPTFGLFTAAGVLTFILGSLLLFRVSDDPTRIVSREWYVNFRYIIITVALLTASFFVFGIAKVIQSKKLRPSTGGEQMIGMEGIVDKELNPIGQIKIHGELWKAKAKNQENIGEGSKIKVVDRENLLLLVKKV